MPRLLALTAALALAAALAACGGNGDGEPTPTEAPTSGPTVAPPEPTEEPAGTPEPSVSIPNTEPAAIALPAGFTAYEIAGGFERPTSVAVGPNGELYLSARHGNVFRLFDSDGDGVYEGSNVFATVSGGEITGLYAASDGTVYVSYTGSVATVRDPDGDGVGDAPTDIISGLPNGRHQNNGLTFGPDGMLYLTNGSTCDDCVEADERSAAVLQANPDGSGLRVFASGLRNPYDIAFDGQGRLWATDNGSDEPCETVDELNLLVGGGDYGWPYGAEGCDPFSDGTPPVANLGLHTASTGVDAYDASHFPPEYGGDLFATLWGSVVFEPEIGPSLLRIVLSDAGGVQPSGTVEQFGTGFANPIDVLVDADGTLLVVDYGTGALYRVIYTG